MQVNEHSQPHLAGLVNGCLDARPCPGESVGVLFKVCPDEDCRFSSAEMMVPNLCYEMPDKAELRMGIL